ncbi:protein HAIKU1-like [Vicia villosa]|uniref:protein HAIKU1-like n=1 Tax=Vicia villosa TaxID=3911 RepID=UPI00273C44A1|nr:protein HAIKU1-like [Vicia villosa]
MENWRNRLNENMGVNKMGKTIKKNSAQQTIEFGHNGRHHYPPSKIHHIHRDDFKSFVMQATGRESNRPTRTQSQISRLQQNRPPPLANVRPFAQFPMQPPPPRAPYINGLAVPPLQPTMNGPPLFDNLWNTFVESPITAFMRKFRDSENYYGGGGGDASRGNQFQQYPPPQQMINNVNVNVQFQPQYFPIQTQMVNNVEQYNLSSATNQTLPMNPSNQFLNGYPQSQTNYTMSPTSEFLLTSPTQKPNVLSPQPPYRPLLSSSIFSSPSSPDFPFQPYLHNE